MKVALFYQIDEQVVPPHEALTNQRADQQCYLELPLRLGAFCPVVLRKWLEPGIVHINAIWVFVPEKSDTEQRELAGDHYGDFEGMLVPRNSILFSNAPQWIAVGINYAKEVYRPLFHFQKEAAPGLRRLAAEDPKSFNALAMINPIPKAFRRRLALAYLLGKWDMMDGFGLRVTEQMRIDEYAKVTGTDVSTLKAMKTVKQRICRELRKHN